MRILLAAIFSLCFIASNAQKEIKLAEVKDHIGDSVKVEGIISGVRYLETAKNTPTFINVGGNYPNQLLTVVIWGDVRKYMSSVPATKDEGSKIIVTGKIELYKDKPQIVVKDPAQLEIVQDAQGHRNRE